MKRTRGFKQNDMEEGAGAEGGVGRVENRLWSCGGRGSQLCVWGGFGVCV